MIHIKKKSYFQIKHNQDEEEHKMTLAQRKSSVIWTFIDSKPQPVKLNDNLLLEEEELSSEDSAKPLRE